MVINFKVWLTVTPICSVDSSIIRFKSKEGATIHLAGSSLNLEFSIPCTI